MRRSSVRFRQAAPPKPPGQRPLSSPGGFVIPRRAPEVSPAKRCAASHRFWWTRWPYRSIVIAAEAWPRILCTTLGSAPTPSQTDAFHAEIAAQERKSEYQDFEMHTVSASADLAERPGVDEND